MLTKITVRSIHPPQSLRMPAVMIEVLQRFTWNGKPKEIGDFFRLTKKWSRARGDLLASVRLGSATARRIAEGTGLVAGLPHSGGSVEHRRKMESRDDREGLGVMPPCSFIGG